MRQITTISSPENPLIKEYLKIQLKSRYRRESGLFVIEGLKEIDFALANGYEILYLFVRESNPVSASVLREKQRLVLERVFKKMVYRESTVKYTGILRQKPLDLESMKGERIRNVIMLEGIEKPGNLGAILRTVDGSGIEGLLLCNSKVDPYNPNVIRASVGCLFATQMAICSNEEAYHWCKSNRISILVTDIRAKKVYWDSDLTKPLAVVMGSEASGVSKFWQDHADERIKLPMNGINDSLNVSVTAGIILYEIVRQNQKQGRQD